MDDILAVIDGMAYDVEQEIQSARRDVRLYAHKQQIQIDKLKEALHLILPLARGYVMNNKVGNNEKYIKIAQDLLGDGLR